MSEESTLYKLVNPEFDFEWNGNTYHIRKANLEQVALYQQRAKELAQAKDQSSDARLIAYCVYLMLRDQDPSLTEEFVMKNTPGDTDIFEVLSSLGFTNPTKMKAALERLMRQQTSPNSSLPSPTEQDGPQEKSGN